MTINDKTVYTIGKSTSQFWFSNELVLITGARRATPYGIALAEQSARIVAECGLTLLTTASMGCGVAAARAALEMGGKVVVAMGTGADVLYPQSSRDVYEKADLIISNQPWGTTPRPFGFKVRDEMLGNLADACIVTECGERSGVFSLAEKVAIGDKDAPVWVFPGSVFSPMSAGSNRLCATNLVRTVWSMSDLEDKVRKHFGLPTYSPYDVPSAQPVADDILTALTANPMRPNELAMALHIEGLEVLRKLAAYEMNGKVERLPDGRYAPSVHHLTFR